MTAKPETAAEVLAEMRQQTRDGWTSDGRLCQFADRLERALSAQGEAVVHGAPEPLTNCPITDLKFFTNVEHPELGTVATYGGPFNSYTIPCLDEDGELRRERYDWDADHWIEGGEGVGYFYRDQQPAPARVTEWTDDQCIAFACVAFRHAPKNLPKGVELNDIRMGAIAAVRSALEADHG